MSHIENKELLAALGKCAAECNHCATACLQEEDVKMLERCIRLDNDCKGICFLAADFVARGSEHAEHVLRECAEICNACAEECEKHAQHMEHCKTCAQACRECAEVCSAGVAMG
jgi:hypothetical protein